MLDQRVGGDLFGPELPAEEDHGAGETEGEVVVLHGILEDLLHGAGAAGRVDDAAEGQGEDDVFADAVFEELGDVRGEGRGGLVAVEPGGNAQARVAVLGIFVYHPEGRGKPAEGIIVERGRCGQLAQGILHFFLLAPRHPGTEMCGFHGTRPAPAEEVEALFREAFAEEYDLAVHGICALQGVAAHHADESEVVVRTHEVVQGRVHPVVMERTRHRFLGIVGNLALGHEVAVGPHIEAPVVGFRQLWVEALIELFRGVQLRAVHLEGHRFHVLDGG